MGLLAALSLCVDHKSTLHADSVSRVQLLASGAIGGKQAYVPLHLSGA